MIITKTSENDKTILILEGVLDTATASQLQEVLIPAFDDAMDITLDFSKLDYVSSAGLRILLIGQKTANAKGASMAVTKVQDGIKEVFEITGFSDMLTIID